MKTKLILLFAVLWTALRAVPFTGTFTCSIEQSATLVTEPGNWHMEPTVQGAEPGSAFSGSYSFDADSPDGTFRVRDGLTGGIDLPASLYASGFLDFASAWLSGFVTIQNGVVTDFGFCPNVGSFSANFLFGGFNLSDSNLGTSARGSIAFDGLEQGPSVNVLSRVGEPGTESVPDGGSTAVLLAIGAAALAWRRRS